MKQPTTLLEAIVKFSDEKKCTEHLALLRWENGKACCPKCGSDKTTRLATRPVWKCMEKGCYKQFSVKVGTIFEKSQVPLSKWLPTFWLIANAKNGISSCELARSLGVTQKTAWFMLQRVREVMKSGTFLTKFKGEIESDETYLGGRAKYFRKKKQIEYRKNRRIVGEKTVVMGLAERGGEIRAMVVDNARRHNLLPMIIKNVEEGSIIYTDKLPSYNVLSEKYTHKAVDHSVTYVDGSIHTNTLESFWSLFKRTVKGTYIHIAPFHTDRYLDEQTFRYNHRNTNDYNRFNIVASNILDKRLTHSQLTGKIKLAA